MSKNSWKKKVWENCGGICVVCGKPATSKNPLTVHHMRPKSRGGANSIDNCVLWHRKFHQDYHKKHGLSISDVFGNPK